MNLTPGYLLWPLMGACLAAAALSAAVQAARGEVARRAEVRALADREGMALERYEALSRQHREILMLRHDMKRHLLALRGMTDEPRAAAYLDELLGQAEAASGGVSTGNRMLDILLGSRLASARAAGIAVELDRLQAPETLPLSDGELCSLILNILDNAIAGAKAPGLSGPGCGWSAM